MIRKKTNKRKLPIVIDLDGEKGNAYYLLSLADKLAIQMKFDRNQIYKEMTSGDYENLLKVFDKYFGNIVILERS